MPGINCSNQKLPSLSVVVPVLLPSTSMLTPISGSWVFSSTTFPLMRPLPWANMPWASIRSITSTIKR